MPASNVQETTNYLLCYGITATAPKQTPPPFGGGVVALPSISSAYFFDKLRLMLKEIGDALVNAINEHQETAVSGLIGVLGTMLGAIGSGVWAWWRRRGEIRFTPIDRFVTASGNCDLDSGKTVYTEIYHIPIRYTFRALNTYPSTKSLTLMAAELYPRRRSRWLLGKPVFAAQGLSVGQNGSRSGVEEFDLPSGSFGRISVEGTISHGGTPIHIGTLKTVHALRLTFLVAPNTKLNYWCPFKLDVPIADTAPTPSTPPTNKVAATT